MSDPKPVWRELAGAAEDVLGEQGVDIHASPDPETWGTGHIRRLAAALADVEGSPETGEVSGPAAPPVRPGAGQPDEQGPPAPGDPDYELWVESGTTDGPDGEPMPRMVLRSALGDEQVTLTRYQRAIPGDKLGWSPWEEVQPGKREWEYVQDFVPASQLELALSRIGELEGRLQEAEKALRPFVDEGALGSFEWGEWVPADGLIEVEVTPAEMKHAGDVLLSLAHLRTEEGKP